MRGADCTGGVLCGMLDQCNERDGHGRMEQHWFSTLQGTAAVDLAARLGLLDAMAGDGQVPEIAPLLRELLVGTGVLRGRSAAPELTPSFAAAWRADSAGIRACASFMLGAASDVATGLELMLSDLPAFMQRSQTFQLFRYDQALGTSTAEIEATRGWVCYLEALSRREAPVLAPMIRLDDGTRLLEVGGNTGLMAAELVATYKGVTATVLDLPAVCALGRASAAGQSVSFVPGDARQPDAFDRFAGQIDAVLFKSVLHDWPEDDARDMLDRAIGILPSGGQVIVCERGAFGAADAASAHMSALANLVFAPFYRAPDFYVAIMENAGLSVSRSHLDLDMRFHVTAGRKP